MPADKPTALWLNRYPMVDPEHTQDLEQRAAIAEFSGKLPRHLAEEKAHKDYLKDQLTESAAHHLVGLRSAHAAGNTETAVKHAAMMTLALRALGHDNSFDPPDEVKSKALHTPADLARFKPHPADSLSIAVHHGEQKPLESEEIKKAEGEDVAGRPILNVNAPQHRDVESRRYGMNGRVSSGPHEGKKNPYFNYDDMIPSELKQPGRPNGITIHQTGKTVTASLNGGYGEIQAFRRGDGGYAITHDGIKRAHELIRPYRQHVVRALTEHLKNAHGAPYVMTGDEPTLQGAPN